MNNNIFNKAVLASAVCSALSTTAQAAAQPDASARMEETVITASRVKERLFDSPASLSVINQQDLGRSTAPTLAEIMRDVPGIQVSDSGQPGLGRVRVRGEESRRTAILINSQEVTDHHEVGTPLTLHPAMVERIEVIRGSGSVLYGSRALSGVVNFITRKGGGEPFQATLSAGYNGATSGVDAFASVFGNVDGFEYRLAYSDSDHEERQTPEGEMENTVFENNSLYLYAGKGFGDHHLEYTYEDYESSSHIFVEEEVKTSFPLTDFYLETPKRDREKHALFYTWDADNSWFKSVQANSYYQESDRHFFSAVDTIWYQREINTVSDLGTEGALAQLNFQPLGDHQVIAGLQYLEDEVDQTRHVDTFSWSPVAPSGIEIIRDKANIETWAWFVQDQWQASERLSVTAGLRQYFVDGELEYSDRESLARGDLDDDNEIIASLGVVWEQSDHMRLRVSVSEGYVYPSLMQLATGAYAGSSFVNPDPDLKPETSINYELGLRYQRSGLVVDTTAFYTESEDYIHHLPCTPADNCAGRRDRTYLNIGESKAHGVELYLGYQIEALGLEPYTSLTWMQRRNEFDDFSTWDSGIPTLSGTAGLRWQGPVLSMPGVWINTYLRGESSSDLEEPGTVRGVLEEKDSWVTVNIAAGLEFGHKQQYQWSLELLNLTDKSYIASTENLYGVERSVTTKLTFNW